MRARTGGSVIHVGVVTDPEKRFSTTFAVVSTRAGSFGAPFGREVLSGPLSPGW